MKAIKFLPLLLLLTLLGCKKDKVDGSDIKHFQSSINDMTTSLPTIKQIKFNEALYLLKSFGVSGKNDIEKLNNLAKKINGKNVNEIFQLADEVAKQNNIDWDSTEPPSLGQMNIFKSQEPTEIDPNDVPAYALSVKLKPIDADSLSGSKAVLVVPRLVDDKGNDVNFSNAALEASMDVYSGGSIIYTAKSLMKDNHFQGIRLRFSSLVSDRIVDNQMDIKVSVKTAQNIFTKEISGVKINPNALKQNTDSEEAEEPVSLDTVRANDAKQSQDLELTHNVGDPKATIQKFLKYLDTQNLKAAYSLSDNPAWGDYGYFSNSASGFGAVKSIKVKNISTKNIDGNSATVNAVYNVTDKNDNSIVVSVNYGLNTTDNGWKIVSYDIISSQKQ
ncbi:DUF6694 family lipoprotein [Riemerella columbipharyngis]|uniref:NTF2-like N-terminal transpeptidase domain-containing protein n=1 Tax=Riemerella columbipharyngis TaxID=1071918 RepID=A0A1G7EE07_9FLAO|nr:DUF6694 family lipoprotein [Riemerella columbipharyngis]SDE61913.1 hypothetical protein SAMN05421544_11541 [Riemerella columbipharyngis]